MTASRRKFLIGTGTTIATSAFLLSRPSRLFANPLGKPIGLQLYTVSEQLKNDYDGTLQQVAAIGYREVESAGSHGKKPSAIKKSFDDAGLRCTSVHMEMGNVEESLILANEVGAKYVISSVTFAKPPVSSSGEPDIKAILAQLASLTLDDYKIMAQRCNEMGEQAKRAGLEFGYHNHNFEFRPYPGGGLGYDELLTATDPALVKFELDCGWMAAAGQDPAVYLTKYPTRYRLLHIKDFHSTESPSVGLDESSRPKPTELGRGHVDYKSIFAAAKKSEVVGYFVEQEPPFEDMPAMEAIKVDYEYLHRLA
jgi:sugar phosphate isomerase/epimerase